MVVPRLKNLFNQENHLIDRSTFMIIDMLKQLCMHAADGLLYKTEVVIIRKKILFYLVQGVTV